jgi:hypothetical protein
LYAGRRFLTLPLWIEQDGLRLVHACWDQQAINIVKQRRPDGRLHPDDLEEVSGKTSPFAKAVETLTSGPEARLPEGFQFHGMKDHPRTNVRIAWWLANGGMWRDVSLSVMNLSELPDTPIRGCRGVPNLKRR